MGNLLGGLFKVILSPLTSFIMSLLYGVLIRGPLTILSYLDIAFQKLSGSQVDQLLFSTSLTDGHTKLNFFTTDSPVRTFFLVMLGVSGALLALFLGFMTVKSISKKKGTTANKLGRVVLSSAIVFAIPTIFLSVLSLSGGVLSAINGSNIKISQSNINNYRKDTVSLINKLKTSNLTASQSFDDSIKFDGMLDDTDTVAKPTSLSLSDIYKNLSSKDWEVSDSVKQLSQQVQDDYQDIKRNLVQNSSGGFELNNNLETNLIKTLGIINQLKPNMKNEEMSDKVKELQNQLQVIQDSINKWVEDSSVLLSYEGSDMSILQNRALANYKRAFNLTYGRKNNNQLMQITTLTNIQDINQVVGYLISGNPSSPGYGLINLRQNLSDLKENSLVVTFYQVATGKHDQNWDRSIGTFDGDGYMLLIGMFLVGAACVIMLLASLFAVTRIFDLALLFIVSPVVVVMSPLDDGKRMGTWINMVIAKLIGIFGIVISLRLFGSLNDAFKHTIESSDMAKGSTGYLLSSFLSALFGIGGMLAAYKSSQTLSGIVGSGYGIMDGMQAGQIFRVIKTGARLATTGTAAAGAMAAKAVGIKKASGGAAGAARSRLGNIASTWKARGKSIKSAGQKTNNALAKVTFGKAGSNRAKESRLSNKFNKMQNKKGTKLNKHFTKSDHIKRIKYLKDEISKKDRKDK